MRLTLAAGGDGSTVGGKWHLVPGRGEQRPDRTVDPASSCALPNPWPWTAAESGEAHFHGYREREEREEEGSGGRRWGGSAGSGRRAHDGVRCPMSPATGGGGWAIEGGDGCARGRDEATTIAHRVARSEARRHGDKIADDFFTRRDCRRLVGKMSSDVLAIALQMQLVKNTNAKCQEQGCNMFTTIAT
jgi:hypothetical protein